MHPRHAGGCIYCGSPGPFSDEHAVCAGLGGDDGAWLLSGCVCRVCNTEIFSKLETKFLRASPVALARLFLQPKTRNQGSKTGTPSVQPTVSYHPDPATGILLEATLGGGNSSEVLPQLVFVDAQSAAVSGQDPPSLKAFLAQLRASIADRMSLVEKNREGFEVVYKVTALTWSDGEYFIDQPKTVSKPPTDAIWLEALTLPATVQDPLLLPPRIFQRRGGQIICRAAAVENAASVLTVLRNAPELLDTGNVDSLHPAAAQASFHQRYTFDLGAFDRVLTKIGINVVAKVLGVDVVRDAAFDDSVDYARDGTGGVRKYSAENSAKFADCLGPSISDRHVLALFSGPAPQGRHALIFMARLYGGPMEGVRLAEFAAPIPELENPIIIHVNYVNHKIERMSLEEHALRIVQDQSGGSCQ